MGTFSDYDEETLKPSVLYGIFSDVTAVIEAREQLAAADREKTRLSDLLDNIPAGVGACALAGGVPQSIAINRHLADHLGIPSGERAIRGLEQLLSYVHADDRDHCRLLLMAFFYGSSRLEMDFRLRLEHTDAFSWMHVEGRILHHPDGTAMAYMALTNITDLKETQKILDEAITTARLTAWSYDIPTHTITMAKNATTEREQEKFGFPTVITNVPDSLAEFVDEGSMDGLRALYRQVEAGRNGSCDVWYKHNLGQEPTCERVTYTVECDETGHPLRAYAVALNITAEKMMAQRYNHIYDQIGDIYPNLIHSFHLNLTQNRFLEGKGQPDLIGGLLADGTADHFIEAIGRQIADDPVRQDFYNRFSRQAMMEWYMNGQTTDTLKYRIRSADGSTHQRNGIVNLARNPGTGDIEATIYELNGDVEMDFENMVRAISQGAYGFTILVDTVTGKIRFGGDTTGDTPEQYRDEDYAAPMIAALKRMMPPDLLEESIRSHSLDNLKAQLRKDPNYQLTYPTTDGRWLQWRFAYVDEEQTQMLIQRADITEAVAREKRQNERLQNALNDAARANEMKSSFLSGMSHDMRTPLNGILRFTDFALATDDPAKKQDYLEKIRASGDLLLNLVSDTLDLSRIESGKLTMDMEITSTRKCGVMVVEALRPMAEEKGVRLIAGPFPNGTIRTDVLKLQKIWLNLLSNAIKYTPAGGTVQARIEIIDPPEQGCNRRLIIEDDGIGMSEAFMENMFEPFAQERRPEARGVMGTGLGLAIVKRYVDFMGGTITVKSAVGKGTRFTVCLPLEIADGNQPLAEGPDEAPVRLLDGRRVLLCEDNRLNAEIATILLKDQGVTVETAVNGQEGLERFGASAPGYYDAILMDIRMPVMDGRQATRAIRALDRPDTAAIPIIAMTADAFAEDIKRAREAGMDGYVTKPIVPDKLFTTLAEAIQTQGPGHQPGHKTPGTEKS